MTCDKFQEIVKTATMFCESHYTLLSDDPHWYSQESH
jgi:hypothetical protein